MSAFVKYLKHYTEFFTWFFLLTVFSNTSLGIFTISDVLYSLFAVFALIKTRKLKHPKGVFAPILYFVIVTIISFIIYSNSRAFFSTLRFCTNLSLCCVFFYAYNNDKFRDKLIKGYTYACVFFSAAVIIQFVSYYVLGVNINLSFLEEYARETNVASSYDVLADTSYRTGGFFKEPSWFAVFVAPVTFILTNERRYKELFICVLGLLLSTSSLGFLILAFFIVWIAWKKNLSIGIFLGIICLLLFLFVPQIFERIDFANLSKSGSFEARVSTPFDIIKSKSIRIFGGDPSIVLPKDAEYGVFFANSATFVYLFFGLVGIFLFCKFFFFKKNIFLSISILICVLSEGLYGRIDFWLMLLACKLFNSEQTSLKHNKQ